MRICISYNGSDFDDAALEQGQSFIDPFFGTKITVRSADSTGAEVDVAIAGSSAGIALPPAPAPAATPAPTATPAPPASKQVDFMESFNEADNFPLTSIWKILSGQAAIRSQQLKMITKSSLVMAAGIVSKNALVTADFVSLNNNASPFFGLVMHYQPDGSYYRFSRQMGGTSQVRITKIVAGVERATLVRSFPNSTAGRPFKLGAQIINNSLVMFVDGKPVLTAVEVGNTLVAPVVGKPQPPVTSASLVSGPSGFVMINTYGFSVDNFEVHQQP